MDHGAATPSLVADMHCPRAGNAREITILDTRNGPTGTKKFARSGPRSFLEHVS